MTVHVVLPELPAAAAQSEALQARLPILQRLLGMSRARAPEPGWRSGLLRELAPGSAASYAPVAVAAMALPIEDTAASLWFAQPVHQLAGISRVHLHPEGVLRLAPGECHELAAAFSRDLGGAGAALHALGDGLICAATESMILGQEEDDPINWCGRELSPTLPPLPAGLRRLAAETEMWLHDLPLNTRRQQRGELPVSRLWLWGGAQRATLVPQDTGLRPAWGADAFLHGLSALGLCASPNPQGLPDQTVEDELLAVVGMPITAGRVDLARLESQWFLPLCEALERGRIPEIILRFGGSRWQLRRPGWLRRWWMHK